MNPKGILLILFILKISVIKGDSEKSSESVSEPKHHLHRHQSQQIHHHRSLYHNHTKFDAPGHNSDKFDKHYLNVATTKSKAKYSAEDLLSNKFTTHISNDIDMDPCKSGKFFHYLCGSTFLYYPFIIPIFNLMFFKDIRYSQISLFR